MFSSDLCFVAPACVSFVFHYFFHDRFHYPSSPSLLPSLVLILQSLSEYECTVSVARSAKAIKRQAHCCARESIAPPLRRNAVLCLKMLDGAAGRLALRHQ